MKKKNYILRLISWLSAVYILFCLVITAWTSSYSVFAAEDFWHAVQIRNAGSAWDYMVMMYKEWQGSYTATFLEGLLSPLISGGFAKLRIIMIGCSVMFILSVYWLMYAVFHVQSRERREYCTVAAGGMLFLFLNYRAYPEVYTWFSAAMSYSVPLSFMCFGMGCYLRSNRGRLDTLYRILALVFGFLAAGGSLVVTGTALCLYMLVAVYYLVKNRKFSLWNTLIMAVMIGGAVLNAAAPGNFIHHDQIAQGFRPFGAFVTSYVIAVNELVSLIHSPVFQTVFLIGLTLGAALRIRHGDALARWSMLSIISVFIGFVTVYPLALGYGNSVVPNRCYFVIDSILCLVIINAIMCTGAWISYALRRSRLRIHILFAVLLGVSVVLNRDMFRTLPQSEDIRCLRSGAYAKYREDISLVYRTADDSSLNVVISSLPKAPDHINAFTLSANPESPMNVAVAEYYEIESIRVETLN